MTKNTDRSAAMICRTCGVTVTPSDQHRSEIIKLTSIIPDTASEQRRVTGLPFYPATPLEVTRCNECAERRQRAEAAAAEHPEACRTPEYMYFGAQAVDALEKVMLADDLARPRTTTNAELSWSARNVRLAFEHLLPVARSLAWEDRLREVETRAETLQARLASVGPIGMRFAHVGEETKEQVRGAYVEYLRARAERPAPVRPNDSAGCWLCGIETVQELPSKAASAWSTARINPAPFGGGSGTTEVEVCRECAWEQERIGSWGPSLMDALVLRHAGLERDQRARRLRIHNGLPWGLSNRKRPNAVPMGHLALEAFANRVRAGEFL